MSTMRESPMSRLPEADRLLVARCVDGELDALARARLLARAEAEVDLREALAEAEAEREWFRRARDAEPRAMATATAGFAAGVAAAAGRLPLDEADVDAVPQAAGGAEAGLGELATFGRRLLMAAALLFGLGMLVWSGLLRPTDSGRLQASPAELQRAMEELDARVRALPPRPLPSARVVAPPAAPDRGDADAAPRQAK